MNDLIYKFAATVCYLLFKIIFRCEVIGRENIPEKGRLVIMANHISYLDPPLLGSFLKRRIYFIAKEELFQIPILGYFLKIIGQIPVKRGKPDRTALNSAFKILEEEKVLGVFPEGMTRGKKQGLGKAKSGAILIPIKTETPIVPTGIKFKGRKLKMSFGKPFLLDKYYNKKLTREERNEAGKYIMNKIAFEIDKL